MNIRIDTDKLPVFDMAEQLQDGQDIAEYLSQVLSDGDQDELIHAIGHIAKARGMSQVARDSGLGRESLYKAFSPGANPRFDTVLRVLKALQLDLKASPRLNNMHG